jgi:hypothetical protein
LTGLDGSAGPSGESEIRPASDGGDTVSHPYGIRNPESPHQADPNVIPAAYQGHYHDEVVEGFRNYLIAKGGKVITAVPLTAIDGWTAVADMIVKMPETTPFVIEVKTGENPQFTDSQRRVYPMVQIGGSCAFAESDFDGTGSDTGKAFTAARRLGLLEDGTSSGGGSLITFAVL